MFFGVAGLHMHTKLASYTEWATYVYQAELIYGLPVYAYIIYTGHLVYAYQAELIYSPPTYAYIIYTSRVLGVYICI